MISLPALAAARALPWRLIGAGLLLAALLAWGGWQRYWRGQAEQLLELTRAQLAEARAVNAQLAKSIETQTAAVRTWEAQAHQAAQDAARARAAARRAADAVQGRAAALAASLARPVGDSADAQAADLVAALAEVRGHLAAGGEGLDAIR